MLGIFLESKLEKRFFPPITFGNKTYEKNSKLDFVLESFEEDIPDNFQTFSKNCLFEDIFRRTSKKVHKLKFNQLE